MFENNQFNGISCNFPTSQKIYLEMYFVPCLQIHKSKMTVSTEKENIFKKKFSFDRNIQVKLIHTESVMFLLSLQQKRRKGFYVHCNITEHCSPEHFSLNTSHLNITH